MQWGVAQLQTTLNWCSQLARMYPPAHMKAQPWSERKEKRKKEMFPSAMIKQWFGKQQNVLFIIQTMNYGIYSSYSWPMWIGPWQIWDRLYSKPIFIKGACHFSLRSKLAVVEYNLLWLFAMHHMARQGRFVTNSNTPDWSRAAKNHARMTDWLCNI